MTQTISIHYPNATFIIQTIGIVEQFSGLNRLARVMLVEVGI